MGWKPVSHKKHHDKRETDKHPPSMMRSIEDGIFTPFVGTDKDVVDVEVRERKE